MKKQERIREVIEYLITSGKFNRFQKRDIEKAIIVCRQPLDERTRDNWFRLLWQLEYIVQPECGFYMLNIPKIQELEVKLPVEVDPKQRRLPSLI
jgi:hypothetical protein